MIKRIWRGWTSPPNADAYEQLLCQSIAPAISARRIDGHRSTKILRRTDGDRSEVNDRVVELETGRVSPEATMGNRSSTTR